MPIDPRIALGVQPLQVADPMAKYSQLAGIQNAQQTNQLKQMQMREAEATSQERNALRQLDPSSPDYEAQLFRLNPQLGISYRKEQAAANASKAAAGASNTTAAKNKQAMLGQAYRDISSRPSDANITAHLEDVLTSPLYDDTEKTNIQTRATKLLAMPFEERKMFLAQQGASAGELKPTVQSVNRGGQTDILNAPAFGGAPTTVATFAEVPLPAPVLAQKKDIAKSSASNITNKQESAFESGLGKGQADRIIASQVAAQDAAAIIDTVKTGRDIMKSGMITGKGADFLVNLNQALKTAGIDSGYADAAANSQAFAANMAGNVGRLIKQFGAGTGLSDADREFATDMAGGRISLDDKAINKILNINEKAARNIITRHNKDVKGVKTNIPLEVEMPPAAPSAPVVTAPAAAIDYLRANPSMKGAFDAKYGAGAADRALKGQ
jgi:hypothetical protein